MCQLLGLNCAEPTDFSFSLRGFCQRGGATDIHSHGWGLCVYVGRGVRCFHDTLPACESPIAELVQNYPIRTYVSCFVWGLLQKLSEVLDTCLLLQWRSCELTVVTSSLF